MPQEDISINIENALKKLSIRDEKENINCNKFHYINEDGKKYDTTKRIIESVEPPINTIPNDDEIFDNKTGKPNYKYLMNHFKREGKLREDQLITIIKMVNKIFKNESNLINVDVPAIVVGDIHGQFYDLIGMFELCGDPINNKYIFLGDYVDRGDRSIEVLILLYSIKINFPNNFIMLRGNHESSRMTEYFTFKKECIQRYSENLYKESIKSFKYLPLCAILNNQFFCVHGGISSSLIELNDINKINRFVYDFPNKGLFCDLVWSDPSINYDEEEINENDFKKFFKFNSDRRCSEFFTSIAAETFLNNNNLLSIIRGHQPQDKGYRMYKINEKTGFPSLITIFSAPNYCGTYDNMAAILKYDGESFNIKQFDSYPAPYFLPNQMNVFEWSIPFVSEKVLEILSSILNICTEDELNENEILLNSKSIKLANDLLVKSNDGDNDNESNNLKFGNSLKKKLLLVGKMAKIVNLLRQESENTNNLSNSKLIDGREELHNHIKSFEEARDLDLKNEGLPPTNEERIEQEKERVEKFEHYL